MPSDVITLLGKKELVTLFFLFFFVVFLFCFFPFTSLSWLGFFSSSCHWYMAMFFFFCVFL